MLETGKSGRQQIAGVFTSMKSGWVEGAIESGLRAARQIDPAITAKEEAPGVASDT